MGTSLDIVRANFSRRRDIQGELREIDEAATSDKRDYTDAEKSTITERRSELEAIDGRIQANVESEIRSQEITTGIESMFGAMLNKDTGKNLPDTRSIGERTFDNAEYRAWVESGARGTSPVQALKGVDYRAVTDTTLGSTSGGAFVVPTMIPKVGQLFLDRKVFLSDLLSSIPVPSGAVEYVQDVSPLADLADKAVEVTEDTAKPQGGVTTALVVEPIATIAEWINITRQAAADVPQMQGYLDTRLRYALKRRLDKQIISGNGTAPNLKGLTLRSNIVTNAPGAAEARYVTVRHTITLMEAVEASPEIIVLNPADAELFDLANSTTAGLHAVPNVADGLARTAWGLTQVRSTAIASGTALLLDPTCCTLFDRMEPTAYLTDSHASNFTSNLLTMLLELRAGLGLFSPSGVGVATFNGTI